MSSSAKHLPIRRVMAWEPNVITPEPVTVGQLLASWRNVKNARAARNEELFEAAMTIFISKLEVFLNQ